MAFRMWSRGPLDVVVSIRQSCFKVCITVLEEVEKLLYFSLSLFLVLQMLRCQKSIELNIGVTLTMDKSGFLL